MRTTLLAALLAVLCLGATPQRERARTTDVHIAFAGVITHVLDPARPARAVTLRGEGHMLHRATLYLRASDIASSDMPMTCDADGTCAIAIDGLRVRIAGAGGRPVADAGGSFDRFVPHLRAVTGGAMAAISEDVYADEPRGAIGAIFELPGGVYSAMPYDGRMRFVPDHEGRGTRTIAQEVFLSSRVTSPLLQFSNGTSIRFREDEELIELRITNEPVGRHPSHFELHYAIAATPLADKPLAVPMSDMHSAAGLGVGCSNTNWP